MPHFKSRLARKQTSSLACATASRIRARCVLGHTLIIRPALVSLRYIEGSSVVTARQAAKTAIFHRVWPPAFIILGLGVTAFWAALLAYGVVVLIGKVV